MTVVQPNSIAGINSISVQSGNALNLHKSDGTLIRTLVAESGISTYSSISVGSATTDNNANKSINIGLGASIAQHADNTLSFGTNGDERARITSAGNIGVGNDASFPIYTDSGDRTLILGSGSDDAAIQLHSGTDKYGGLYFGDTTSGGDRYSGYVEYKHDDNFLRFGTGGTERVRIDSGGRLLLGATTSQEVYGTNPLQIQGTTAATSGMSLLRHGGSPYLVLGSSGGSSLNAVTALSSGNRIGQLTFAGADGTDINTHSASVAAYVDGSVSSNAVPGRLVFKTSTGASEVERLRITSAGRVGIAENDPDTTLHVKVTSTEGIRLERNGGTVAEWVNDTDLTTFGTTTNHNVAFKTNGTERMRVTNGGLDPTTDAATTVQPTVTTAMCLIQSSLLPQSLILLTNSEQSVSQLL